MSDRPAGILGALAAAALAVGGVAAGFALEHQLVRGRIKRGTDDAEPFFSLTADGPLVATDDGVVLHTEIDEPPLDREAGGGADAPTIVLVHGYALSLHCWHFQRSHLRRRQRSHGDPLASSRVVLYDQRSHGRSSVAQPDHCRIDWLGTDLERVLTETVGTGDVILIGHSMGGMTIMELARTHPEWFDPTADTPIRVRAVGLIATASGGLAEWSPIAALPGKAFSRVAPPVLASLNRLPRLVERTRRAGSDLGWAVTRQWAFGRPDVPADYVDFMSQMLADTPLSVIADFYPAFATLDEQDAMPALRNVACMITGGTDDLITPVAHTVALIDQLPGAATLIQQHCGHMGILEWHDQINDLLDELIARATDTQTSR